MRSFLLAAVACLFLIAAGGAQAAPSVTGVFDLPDKPTQNPPALGPDGNVWVTLEQNVGPDFAKVAPDGTVTPVDSPDINGVHGIVAGPDGNMWVTGTGFVGRFSPANPLTVTKFPTISIGSSNHIIVGPDGNLWTGSDGNIVRITPTAVPSIDSFPSGISGFTAKGIAAAGGKLWVANGDNAGGGVLPVTTAGVVQPQITFNKQVQQVAAGLNGQIAYTAPIPPETIGLIDNGVPRTPTTVANIDPFGIIFAQDEAYWTPQFGGDSIARYTSDGSYTIPITFPANSGPRFATVGSNNTIWVGFETSQKIARISGIEPPDSTPPAITKLSLTNKTFKIGPKTTALTAKAKKKPKTGTKIKFTLSEAGTVTIAVEKAATGRKSGKSCVKPTAKNKRAKKCTRYVAYRTKLTRTGKLGANSVAFSGRFGKTKLKPGKYRFALTATDARGNATPKTKTTKFTVVTK